MKAPKQSGTILRNDVIIKKSKVAKIKKEDLYTIIGIDPGLQHLGVGIISIEKNKIIKPEIKQITKKKFKKHYNPTTIAKYIIGYSSIIIKLKQNHEIDRRLHYIFETLSALFVEHGPDLIIVEDAFVGLNKNSALKLGLARGAILTAIGGNKIPYQTIPPKQIKMEITGNGCAMKEEILELLESLLPHWNKNLDKTSSHDASDAMAAAFCGIKFIF